MSDTLVRDSTTRILQINPTLSYAEIGRLLGVSRERIRQVAGVRRRKPGSCRVCGRTIRVRRNGVTQTAYRMRYCAECWARARQRRRESRRIQYTCEVCGKTFSRTPGTVRRMERRGHKIRWCSRQCQGKWLGAHQSHEPTEPGTGGPSPV